MIAAAHIAAAWPLAASMAAVVAQGLREGRRRVVLNEALHELRRPLQAVALAVGPEPLPSGRAGNAIELAAAALERLDHEINGAGSPAPIRGAVDGRSLVLAAVERWRERARLAGAVLELRWNAGQATVGGDRRALAQALDNLIVNAIQHGGPTIVVSARLRAGALRIAVADSGRELRPRSRRGAPVATIERLSGRRRHGHGLGVVSKIVAAHDGQFALRRTPRGSLAVLELPLIEVGERWA